jgi:hypothetical protein
LGGLIRFPRNARRGESHRHDATDDAAGTVPVRTQAALITLHDATRTHDGDDDGDGGGRAA